MKFTGFAWLGIATLALVVCVSTLSEGGESAGGMKPCVSLWGAKSEVRKNGYFLIGSTEELAKVWSRHTGRKEPSMTEALGLSVDFARYQVIAVFGGETVNTSGIECVEMIEEQGLVRFRFRGLWYQTLSRGGEEGGVPAVPWGLFVIPRVERPVVLEEDVKNLIGGPPVWKQRARFEPKPVK